MAIVAGNAVLGGNEFIEALSFSFRQPVNDLTAWLAHNAYFLTEGLKNVTTSVVINPIQTVLTSAPWWLVVATVVGIGLLTAGLRPAIIAGLCLVAIAGIEMWEHSMETLTAVLVATLMTLVIGLVFGILSARSDRFSAVLRPLLDAAQTMPAFVYLLPAVALFGPTRFTGIIAALIYSVPPVIRLVEIGIRTVPATRARGRGRGRLDVVAAPRARSSCRWPARRSSSRRTRGSSSSWRWSSSADSSVRAPSATTSWPGSPGATSSARASRPAWRSSSSGSCSTA